MTTDLASYLDNTGRADRIAGGVRMIPVTTPSGDHRVWTKRFGTNPTLRVLLLHGGPGATHEYLESFEGYLPQEGIEFYHYDQLGSGHSDRPGDPSLWEIDRFVDEVEQVRLALGLDASSFVLYGQSWGGILALEYALAHPDALRGLVVSNMMSSIPAYNAYATDVLMPTMDPDVLAEIKRLEATGQTGDPSYDALLMEHHYVHHVCRMPVEEWPEPVVRGLGNINKDIYVPLQGPSELGASGKLIDWDRSGDLASIDVPTLVIGAEHDTMDPRHLAWMAEQLPRGSYHHCPDGSHLAMVDDADVYFAGLVTWLRSLD
ncbi:proline iminopeptidase-family hydrolase [Nocardioides sp. LS1]|uniref:proline iminopeptidase-family hydrolase n=1 Tax=Nocardioides sp. LS1 TaxID=1027620 RepID=UPI000FF91983|nr:proline iminopeptidase-family hydrolase [Nocardioides sp. LS1]GCD88544.1 proline iminopeptidase [Nocardioides sp. LS1]